MSIMSDEWVYVQGATYLISIIAKAWLK